VASVGVCHADTLPWAPVLGQLSRTLNRTYSMVLYVGPNLALLLPCMGVPDATTITFFSIVFILPAGASMLSSTTGLRAVWCVRSRLHRHAQCVNAFQSQGYIPVQLTQQQVVWYVCAGQHYAMIAIDLYHLNAQPLVSSDMD